MKNKHYSNQQFTEEQIKAASRTSIVDFLRAQGEDVKRVGREYQWKSHDSVMINGNLWYRFSTSVGGDAIKFVMYFYEVSFRKAVEMLLNQYGCECIPYVRPAEIIPKKPFAPPLAAADTTNVYRYLVNKRGIRRDVVEFFVNRGDIYQDVRGQIVFKGSDEHGQMKYAHVRSLSDPAMKKDVSGSEKAYSFRYEDRKSSVVFVTEAAVDLLSLLSLYATGTQFPNAVSLGGVSPKALEAYLRRHPETNTVCLCLDADQAGQDAERAIQRMLPEYMHVVRLLPLKKDWNDELTVNIMDAHGNHIKKVVVRKKGDLKALLDALDEGADEAPDTVA